jgi:hypothetical protein
VPSENRGLISLIEAPKIVRLRMRVFGDKEIFQQPSASRWAAAFIDAKIQKRGWND